MHETALKQFQKVVRTAGGRWTKERAFLLQMVCNAKRHFIVKDIVRVLHQNHFNVSMTTVYRNLSLLLQAGIIRRASLGGGGG